MKCICVLVHDPFRVVLNIWEVCDEEDAVAYTIQAMQTGMDLSCLGFISSIVILDDEDPLTLCTAKICDLRRRYIQETLNGYRNDPGKPFQDLVNSN